MAPALTLTLLAFMVISFQSNKSELHPISALIELHEIVCLNLFDNLFSIQDLASILKIIKALSNSFVNFLKRIRLVKQSKINMANQRTIAYN